eukprot:15468423-Alexandrium_andersonii.AAC.1
MPSAAQHSTQDALRHARARSEGMAAARGLIAWCASLVDVDSLGVLADGSGFRTTERHNDGATNDRTTERQR